MTVFYNISLIQLQHPSVKNWYILYIHSKKPPEFSSEGILNRVVTPLSTGFIGKPGVFLSHSSSDKYI